jgi:hypothetical protein
MFGGKNGAIALVRCAQIRPERGYANAAIFFVLELRWDWVLERGDFQNSER